MTPNLNNSVATQTVENAMSSLSTVSELEQLRMELAQQTEKLKKETDCRQRAEFLTHQHIDGLISRTQEMKLFANLTLQNLKTPLSAIEQEIGQIKTQYSAKSTSELMYHLQIIEQSIIKMYDLLNTYLGSVLQKTESTPFHPLSILSILESAERNLSDLVEKQAVSIIYDRSEFNACPTLMGDSEQLIAMLEQLIQNAIQFRSADPVVIHLKVDVQKELCLITVQDNGQGVDPHYFDQIFWFIKPKQLPNTLKPNSIGLAICKKIIELHGGKIWISSVKEQGSTFYIILPITT